MQAWIAENLHTFGPWAVFFLLMLSGIGVPLGADVIVIPAGILVCRGDLPLWETLIAAYVGVCAADTLWFLVITRYGAPLLHRRWFKRMVHPRRLLEAKHQMEQRGTWVVVCARFIPGSRTSVITVAGLLHLKPWKFISATCACVAITAPMQIGFGWLIARGFRSDDDAELVQWIIGAIVLAAVLVFVYRMWRRHRVSDASRPPRARVRWLKRFRKRSVTP